MDGGEDCVPDPDEVAAAGVAEDAEGGIVGVGGQDVADELVAVDKGAGGAEVLCLGFD